MRPLDPDSRSGGHVRLPWRSKGQPAAGLLPHVVSLGVVGDHEHQVVPERPEGGPLGALAGMDPRHELRNALDEAADVHRVMGQDDQLRPSVSDLVGYVERPAGEGDGVEAPAVEDRPDAVVQLGPRLLRIHVPLLAPDDLAEVRLREKTHRSAPPVVEVGGLRDELLARFLDEAEVGRGAEVE